MSSYHNQYSQGFSHSWNSGGNVNICKLIYTRPDSDLSSLFITDIVGSYFVPGLFPWEKNFRDLRVS